MKTIAVVFGGVSSEHEVSCMSVQNVVKNIDTDLYDYILIGITKEGRWLLVDSIEDVKAGTWYKSKTSAVISPDAEEKCIIISGEDICRKASIDAVFPVLHGLCGEDGTIQGLCELAQIPYVGCGVLASAVTMDKLYTKIIVDRLGIRQAAYVPVLTRDLAVNEANYIAQIESEFDYPVFIKPSCGGSSCGVTCAKNREQLIDGLKEAAKFDTKILVEETIIGHEIECAVFGGGSTPTFASGVGEILAAAEFYDYDSKYINPTSQTVIGPELPAGSAEKVRECAIRIFDAVDGYGLSRVDFFVTEEGEVVFNEINTIPGFTGISMWPMLMEAAGMSKKEQVQKLIELAFNR